MISTTFALWLVAMTVFPQTTQSCNGDCHEGYRSVCVQRGSNCKCSCIKDVASGARALRELLKRYNAKTIKDAEQRYMEMAGKETGEFSFTVKTWAGSVTIIGQGFSGTVNPRVDPGEAPLSGANATLSESQRQLRRRQQVHPGTK